MITQIFPLAKYHKNFDVNLYNSVLNQDINLVNNIATIESRKLYKLHTEVAKEIHLKKGFLRFSFSNHGILYTKTKLEHKTINFLLRFFHERFPTFIIAIEVNNITHIIDKSGFIEYHKTKIEEIIKKLEDKMPIVDNLKDLDNSNDNKIFEEYYNSQFVRNRKNLKLQQQMMPLKHRDDNNIETVISKRCKSLIDY